MKIICAAIKIHDENGSYIIRGHRKEAFNIYYKDMLEKAELPNIQTFPDYKPHITIAYIKKDDAVRDEFIKDMNELFKGKELKVVGLNYGGNK